MIEDKELALLFKAESAEHLARLEEGLLQLEINPSDQAILEQLFRESHSMKGAARMLKLAKIESASHGMETILNTARKGDSLLTIELIGQMTAVMDDLRGLVEEALRSDNPLAEVAALTPQAEFGSLTPENSTANALPLATHLARSASSTYEQFRIETVRVETRKLDDLLTLASEFSVIDGRTRHRLLMLDALVEQWLLLQRNHNKFEAQIRATESTGKFNKSDCQLLQSETGVVIKLGEMLKAARASFYDDGANLEKTVHTLKELVLDARLLPLSTVFTLFPGMVRDLSKQNDKEVDMVIEGGELKVDKRILEEIKDPLMHLLRNAIDHGIESPAEREHHGKARRGVVRLRAFQHNNNVMIEVQDDGRGMDLSALKRAALKLGLHDEAMLDAMTPVQLQHLILLPGFSTSTLVTEMSGRGVGLDVVKINVERLQGTLHLETTPGTGTMMQLCLPLGLSTGRLLMVKVKGYIYGMPIAFVYTSRRILEKDIFMLEGRPAIILDGNSLLAFRLSDLLELPKNHLLPSGSNSITEHEVCIVIQVGSERLGLRVDEILDEEEVVTKPLSAPLKRVRNVSGLTILGNGEICAVLNPADLLLSAHKPTQNSIVDANAAIPFSASHAALKVAILLVEDSALIRTMEKRILEESGYEVVAVVDGLDALNALSLRSFAAVVSDINMPNMDGLALTARIRMDPAYKKLPVILVSSLASDEDKRHGLDVGANAYIPKPTFDQRILLETLKRLI